MASEEFLIRFNQFIDDVMIPDRGARYLNEVQEDFAKYLEITDEARVFTPEAREAMTRALNARRDLEHFGVGGGQPGRERWRALRH